VRKKILYGVLALLVTFIILGFWSYRDVIISVPVEEKIVALTYDDGPNPPDTQALLKVLANHRVKATFFMKGSNVEAFPDSVRAVAAAGHEIGNHSYHHKPMLSFSKSAYVEEIVRTNEALDTILGYHPGLFRAPYGAQGIGLTQALKQLDMLSVGMSVMGSDWSVSDPRLIADAILDSIEPGAIILLHDGHADVADPRAQDSRAASIAATELIIEALRAQGYGFVTVGELLAH
jgi:peptidoglycan/xylan/chitin deacetylase (PgdA/CDA1 family)